MSLLASMPTIAQKDTLKVKEICDALGFHAGTSSAKPHHYLTDSTRLWRRNHINEDGTLGKDLIEWKSPRVQLQLETMTSKYLEEGGYGEKFWPCSEGPSPIEILEYKKDRTLSARSPHLESFEKH